jgi:hypothetical protein
MLSKKLLHVSTPILGHLFPFRRNKSQINFPGPLSLHHDIKVIFVFNLEEVVREVEKKLKLYLLPGQFVCTHDPEEVIDEVPFDGNYLLMLGRKLGNVSHSSFVAKTAKEKNKNGISYLVSSTDVRDDQRHHIFTAIKKIRKENRAEDIVQIIIERLQKKEQVKVA